MAREDRLPAVTEVAKDAPVGFQAIRLRFQLDADEPPERIETLIRLTERYCVVLQSVRTPVPVTPTVETALSV
jgi:uncharacterized OsmC-like protein